MPKNINHICRVCGYEYGEEYPYGEFFPWGENGNCSSHEICACCGVTWGYEDSWIEGIREYRENWLASGAKWFTRKEKPEKWNLEEQLKNIPEKFR